MAYVELFDRVGCLEVTLFVMSLAGDKDNGRDDELLPRTSEGVGVLYKLIIFHFNGWRMSYVQSRKDAQ